MVEEERVHRAEERTFVYNAPEGIRRRRTTPRPSITRGAQYQLSAIAARVSLLCVCVCVWNCSGLALYWDTYLNDPLPFLAQLFIFLFDTLLLFLIFLFFFSLPFQGLIYIFFIGPSWNKIVTLSNSQSLLQNEIDSFIIMHGPTKRLRTNHAKKSHFNRKIIFRTFLSDWKPIKKHGRTVRERTKNDRCLARNKNTINKTFAGHSKRVVALVIVSRTIIIERKKIPELFPLHVTLTHNTQNSHK